MAFFDILMWGLVTGLIGGSIGIGGALAVSSQKKRQDQIRMLKVIKGEIPNSLKLDGEMIEVKKFIYKTMDGEIIRTTLSDIVKKAPQIPLKQEKTSFLSKIKSKISSITLKREKKK